MVEALLHSWTFLANKKGQELLMRQVIFLLASVAVVWRRGRLYGPSPLGTPMQRPPRSSLPKFPPGYRDWKLISVAHEEGNLNGFAPFWATM